MAEENPGTPLPPAPAATPQEAVIDQVSAMLAAEDEAPPPAPEPETAETDDAVEDEAPDNQASPEDHDGQEAESEAEPDEGTAEDDSFSEIPTTLAGLADAIGMTADELAEHVTGTAKINGAEVNISLREAIRGYQRTTDYEQKTTRLATEREALQTEVQAFERAKADRLQQLDAQIQLLSGGPALTDEDLLKINYEQGAAAAEEARIKRDMAANKIAEATKLRDAEMQENQAQQQQRFIEWRTAQQGKAREFMPELAKPESLEAFEKDVRSTLEHYGYGENEVANFFQAYDARQLPILRDAAKYRALQTGKKAVKKTLANIPKAKKPGVVTTRAKRGEQARSSALARLKSSAGKGKRANDAAAKEFVRGLLD